MSSEHYERRLLLKVLNRWQVEMRKHKAKRQQLQDQQLHRKKMEGLLRLALQKVEGKG